MSTKYQFDKQSLVTIGAHGCALMAASVTEGCLSAADRDAMKIDSGESVTLSKAGGCPPALASQALFYRANAWLGGRGGVKVFTLGHAIKSGMLSEISLPAGTGYIPAGQSKGIRCAAVLAGDGRFECKALDRQHWLVRDNADRLERTNGKRSKNAAALRKALKPVAAETED